MSRSVYITRPDPSEEDLIETAMDLIKFSSKNYNLKLNKMVAPKTKFVKREDDMISETSQYVSIAYNFIRKNQMTQVNSYKDLVQMLRVLSSLDLFILYWFNYFMYRYS